MFFSKSVLWKKIVYLKIFSYLPRLVFQLSWQTVRIRLSPVIVTHQYISLFKEKKCKCTFKCNFRSLGNVLELKQQLKILAKIGAISQSSFFNIFTGTYVMPHKLLISRRLVASNIFALIFYQKIFMHLFKT